MHCKSALILLAGLAVCALAYPQSNSLAAGHAGGAASGSQPVGKPQFHVSGGGSGNSARNWGAGGNVGAGVKAWESKNGRHAVGVGANYGQSFGRSQGQSWHSRPDVGAGVGYRYRFRG